MSLKIKNGSHRYDINRTQIKKIGHRYDINRTRERLWNNYTKYKMCLSMEVLYLRWNERYLSA